MIECKLREFTEFQSALPNYNPEKKRKGFYSHTVVSVKGLGKDKWLIIVHIDVDYESYLHENISEKDICLQCIDFLNQPPGRKKYAKKKPKSLYGHLTLHSAQFKEDGNGKYIEAELTTDQRKNKNFWCEGVKYGKAKLPSKLRTS